LGEEVGFEKLTGHLARSGYNPTGLVESVADYSVKGGIVDVFPAGRERPARLDFFGDFLESIRPFRVDDQKSAGSLERLTLVPASEATRDPVSLARGAEELAKLAQDNNWLWLLWEPIARRLKDGLLSADLDDWSGLWSPRKTTALSYLSQGNPVILLEPGKIKESLEAAGLGLKNHFKRLQQEERPHLPLERLYAEPEKLFQELTAPGRSLYVSVETPAIGGYSSMGLDREITFACESNADLKAQTSIPRRATGLLGPLAARVKSLLGRGFDVSLVLRTREQLKRLAGLLTEYDLSPEGKPRQLHDREQESERESWRERERAQD
jgi:transcription-repair coupling factor (superfamily II helicase)